MKRRLRNVRSRTLDSRSNRELGMRRLILSTVSVLALGLGGAGLVYAQGDMSSTSKPAGATAPSASGTSQYGASGTATTPSGAGTSQPGYTGGTTSQSTMPSTSGTSQPGYTGGATSQSTMPSTSARSHARMSRHDEIMEVQQKLQQDNLYSGKIDGRLNRETRQALRNFQKQNGLRVTANLDRETRTSLLGAGHGSSTPPRSHMAPSHSGGISTTR